MTEAERKRRAVAELTRESFAIENQLSAEQARSFVRGLQNTWDVPTIRWSIAESRQQLSDAQALLHAAQVFRLTDGIHSQQAIDCYRRAGEVYEWLSRSNDSLRTTVPIELLAAASFQLGGLPAMARGLLNQVLLEDLGSHLYASFLKADFDAVTHDIANFWTTNEELTTRNATAELLAKSRVEGLEWYFTVELVRAIGLFSDSTRRGDGARQDDALRKLNALEKMATRTFSENASLLIGLLRDVAEDFQNTSIYKPILAMAALDPAQTPRLFAFARTQFNRGRGILWSPQIKGLDRLLKDRSFALCTPTGSGKTLVANLALVKELLLSKKADHDSEPLALYLVPSRALAGEVEAKLRSELGADMIITGLYGGADWGITDYWLKGDRPTVLIATIEKADALMRYVGPLIINRLRLLIVDEAHQVVAEDNDQTRRTFAEHRNRSIRLEAFVSRLLSLAPGIARIALTAVAGGGANPVARWIEGNSSAEAVGTRYRSTRQVIGTIEFSFASPQITLDLVNGHVLYVRGRDAPVYLPLKVAAMPSLPPHMRNSIFRFNEISVLWTALHLSRDDRRILISIAQAPEKTMRWFREAFELPDWSESSYFVPPEQQIARARFEEARAACIDYCGEDSHELFLLNRGIATSHGQMPQRLRRLMTELIDLKICPITVATATLTEGVNLPFDLIFLTSLKRQAFDAETQQQVITPLSIAEFRNLAGRAGRPGAAKGMEGMTLIPIPKLPSTTASSKIALQRQQIRAMENEYSTLFDTLVAEESATDANSPLFLLLNAIADQVTSLYGLEGEDFLSWLDKIDPGAISSDAGKGESAPAPRLADSVDELDSFLLTALEELARFQERELVGAEAETFLVTLWQKTFTAISSHRETWLEQAFVRRGRAIVDHIYPDAVERNRLYQYGFSPHVGRRFELISDTVLEVISAARDYGTATATDRLAIFEALAQLVAADRGFGFKVRATVADQNLLKNWRQVLRWWMRGPRREMPVADDLRGWQRFASENIEFKLGVVIGAVVAQAWSDNADGPLAVPSLAEWRETTGLPWFGFWARELLRWGTLDPFVAFALAQGLAKTRVEAAGLRIDFESWLEDGYEDIDADDLIDPQLFLKWERDSQESRPIAFVVKKVDAELTGSDGLRQTYSVLPVQRNRSISWIDSSGFEIARSENGKFDGYLWMKDFELTFTESQWSVREVFSAN